MLSRFYHEPTRWAEDALSGEEARHAIKVLRLRVGEQIELFDGEGRVALATVSAITGKTLTFERLSEQLSGRIVPRITLYQAIPKGKNMDLIIQKAVELGVEHIQPVITQNTVAVSDSPQKKAEKWQRVALEAAKQCKQPFLPKVEVPDQFSDVTWNDTDLKLVASLRENAREMKDVLTAHPDAQSIALIVGPEGDFTDAEVDALEQAGFFPVSMGDLILRVETATLYGLSVLRFFY